VLEDLLKVSLQYDNNIGYGTWLGVTLNNLLAIAYECIVTIATVYSNSALLDLAASSIATFITNSNPNIKYLGNNTANITNKPGIRGLAEIVKINAIYANAHQVIVIDCIDDVDETIKREVAVFTLPKFKHCRPCIYCMR
jgi:hypothetical protein